MSEMSSLLRRRPLSRRAIDELDPALVGRDVRARASPVPRSRALARMSGALARVLALVAIDVGSIAVALYTGLALKDAFDRPQVLWGLVWRAEAQWLPFIALVLLLVFARAGLYRRGGQRPGDGTVVASIALTTVIIAGFAYATGHRSGTYAIWLWTLVIATMLIIVLRRSFDSASWLVQRTTGHVQRVVICGGGPEAATVSTALISDERSTPIEIVDDVPTVADLELAITRGRAHDVVLTRLPDDETLLEALDICTRNDVRLRVVPTAAGLLAREAVYVPGQSVPLFEIVPPTLAGVDFLVKRAFDLVVAGATMLVLSPLLLVIAICVRLTSRGPVLYRDERIGAAEQPFRMLKFRSMRDGAAAEQAALESANEADGALFKIRRDPRITPVGRFLRRYSLDELPQLWNVVRGDMSLVGPRPLPMRDYARLDDWHRKRYLVLPGMTGLWQISGRSDLGFDAMVRLDFYYLEHWSVWMDISVLVRTPLAVLTARGAR
jgi:exopolysaccharide biosynthesis polyprenyl glycosylphosphotransferase